MNELLNDLGGNTAVAKALNMQPNAVANWRKRGIPWRQRPAVARLAAQMAVQLPADYWGDVK